MLRSYTEQWEKEYFSKFAALSSSSRGRAVDEQNCDIRTIYQRDRDRILHCKAFRRLKHKTQVFIAPEGDHYRTRLTHTLEVAQISRTIARGLRLNEDLTEAISLGHDLGHTPFGHAGEAVFSELMGMEFKHNIQSLRVVDYLEPLNLSFEVRDGIGKHTGEDLPVTLEGQIVRIADRIAYINHDIDDAIRAGIISITDLPGEALEVLGKKRSERIDSMVRDMIIESKNKPRIERSPAVKKATGELRNFLIENVYIGSIAKVEEQKARRLLKLLFNYYLEHEEEIPRKFRKKGKLKQSVIDYVGGMSDVFAINKGRELFIPKPWFEK